MHPILQLAPNRLVKGASRDSFCMKSYERPKLGVFFLEKMSFWVHIGDAHVGAVQIGDATFNTATDQHDLVNVDFL